MEVVSVKTARDIDRCAINEFKIPSISLMETAAQEIFNIVKEMGDTFHIFCGFGNNGGDGLAVARKLICYHKRVYIYIIGESKNKSDGFVQNYEALMNITDNIFVISNSNDIKMINQMNNSDIIIDSIFGSGLNRKVEGLYYEIIKKINLSGLKVISIDIPSGLNGDFGESMGISVKADVTCCIENYKMGFFQRNAQCFLGTVKVISIGIPPKIKELHNDGIYVLSKSDYKKMIPKRDEFGYKGDYGRVLILAGSRGMCGAAFLTTMASLNTGSGLVTLLVPEEIQDVMSSKLNEAMTVNYSGEKVNKLIERADVIACGPGLSQSKESIKMLRKCIENSNCSLVLDADALNILSNSVDLLKKIKNRAVLTPHVGEFSRLTGLSIEEVQKNSIELCEKYSKDNSVITLLKGHNTVISDGNNTIINRTGNSKMASGGMGDTLTGIIASLIGQKINPFIATQLGCYIHGLCAEEVGRGKYSIKASELIDQIQKKMEEILNY